MINTDLYKQTNNRLELIKIDLDNIVNDNIITMTNHLDKYYKYPDRQRFNSNVCLNEKGKLLICHHRPKNIFGLNNNLDVWYKHKSNQEWAIAILTKYQRWIKRQQKRQQRYSVNDCNKYLAGPTFYGVFSDALFTIQSYINWVIPQLTTPNLQPNAMFIEPELTYFAQQILLNDNYKLIINNADACQTIMSVLTYSHKTPTAPIILLKNTMAYK